MPERKYLDLLEWVDRSGGKSQPELQLSNAQFWRMFTDSKSQWSPQTSTFS